MARLKSYIFKQLFLGTIIVTSVLSYIIWLTQSLGFIELIVNKGLTIIIWLKLTLLLLPNMLVVILPISIFLVVLFLYNKMTNDRELIVAQASGISQWQLAVPAITLATFFTIISYSLTLYYAPLSIKEFKELQWSVRNDISQFWLQEGRFNQIGKGLTVYVRERSPDGKLNGILVHDKRDRIKSITLMAEEGSIIPNDNTPKVSLFKGSRQEITRGSGDLSLLYFDSYIVDLGSIQIIGDSRFTDNRERSLVELLTLSKDDGIKENKINKMRVDGHQRITSPLLNLTLTIVALTLILSGTFNKQGQANRIIISVFLVIIIEAANIGCASLASKKLVLIPLMYFIPLVPLILGVLLISSSRVQGLLKPLIQRN